DGFEGGPTEGRSAVEARGQAEAPTGKEEAVKETSLKWGRINKIKRELLCPSAIGCISQRRQKRPGPLLVSLWKRRKLSFGTCITNLASDLLIIPTYDQGTRYCWSMGAKEVPSARSSTARSSRPKGHCKPPCRLS